MAKKSHSGRLLSLKEWLTLDDTAKHLSIVFGEEVSRADVLRLALDRHLTLSVDFVNRARAKKGRLAPLEDCLFTVLPPVSAGLAKGDATNDLDRLQIGRRLTYSELSELSPADQDRIKNHELLIVPDAINFGDGRFLILEQKVESLSGVWDLPMVGGEEIDVQHRYQMETDGPSVDLMNIEGAFVSRGDIVCQLQDDFDDNEYEPGAKVRGEMLEQRIKEEDLPRERADELRAHYQARRGEMKDKWKARPESRYYPAGGLPTDAVFVVRTAALRAFEEAVLKAPEEATDRVLSRREETSLLNIAGGLLGLLLGKSPAGKPQSVFGSQAAVIDALVASYPGKPGMSVRNLQAKLAEARRSLES